MTPHPEQVAYSGKMRLYNAESSHARGYTVEFQLESESDYEKFKTLTKRSRNKAGQMLHVFCLGEHPVEFDCLFYGWTVSNANGAKVKFGISDTDVWDQLRNLPAIASSDQPTQWDVVVAEINDQGEMVDQTQRERVETMRGGPVSQLAGRLGSQALFQQWIGERLGLRRRADPDECAEYIREHCNISSRRELDHDEAAKERFHRWVTKPFAIYCGT